MARRDDLRTGELGDLRVVPNQPASALAEWIYRNDRQE
jgi:hypothetical protein